MNEHRSASRLVGWPYSTRQRLTAVVGSAVLVFNACSSTSPSSTKNAPALKAGGKTGPTIVITIADSQDPGDPSTPMLDAFASDVERLSNGSMSVKVAYDASAVGTNAGGDQPIIEQLRSGQFPMAVVPARAWSLVGVSSMQALQAPFLVQSDQQMNAIAHDASLVQQLFAGLDSVGVHGLTMFPESLRHLFSFSTPILTPADVTGRQIRTPSEPDVATLVSTLGATPVDPPFDEFSAAVLDGKITATDSGFGVAISVTPRPATATGNLVLYPKMVTLAVNAGFWNGLTNDQRGVLTTAADEARDAAIAQRVGDAAAAATYCAGGGAVVLADPAELAAFRAAAQPIYKQLDKDPTTNAAIKAIEALATGTQPAPVQACGTATAPTVPVDLVPDGGSLPNGMYRIEMTDDHLRADGLDPHNVLENHGIITWTLKDGHYKAHQDAEGVTTNTDGAGIYHVEGAQLWFRFSDDGKIVHFTWSVDSDGTLHFKQLEVFGLPEFFFDVPWPRIGDA